jgi:hypothetical protein
MVSVRRVVAQIPGANIKEFLVTILSEAKRAIQLRSRPPLNLNLNLNLNLSPLSFDISPSASNL